MAEDKVMRNAEEVKRLKAEAAARASKSPGRISGRPAPQVPPTRPAPRVVKARKCDNCGRSGAGFPRRDSSGLWGHVCTDCNFYGQSSLSFA